jgi:hypothetical protein
VVGGVRYRCKICGGEFRSLSEWYRHVIAEHPREEPGWARAMRLEGFRVPKWKVYWEMRAEGKVEAVR